jgi:hypothetical protein
MCSRARASRRRRDATGSAGARSYGRTPSRCSPAICSPSTSSCAGCTCCFRLDRHAQGRLPRLYEQPQRDVDGPAGAQPADGSRERGQRPRFLIHDRDTNPPARPLPRAGARRRADPPQTNTAGVSKRGRDFCMRNCALTDPLSLDADSWRASAARRQNTCGPPLDRRARPTHLRRCNPRASERLAVNAGRVADSIVPGRRRLQQSAIVARASCASAGETSSDTK